MIFPWVIRQEFGKGRSLQMSVRRKYDKFVLSHFRLIFATPSVWVNHNINVIDFIIPLVFHIMTIVIYDYYNKFRVH